MAELEAVVGHYVTVEVDGRSHRIYFEEAGTGTPLICLHTAGADARQWRHLLADKEITDSYRVIAFDLPWHGRSLPPDNWWTIEYRLTVEEYAAITLALVDALDLDRPIVIGCSVGGVATLELAWHHADRLRGAIALEAASKIEGRFLDWSIRPDIDGSEFAASWTYGLMAPQGPEESRREVWWIYAGGGPGVYRGDTWAWSEGFDLRGHEHEVDTRKCPLQILAGEYDYVCTPNAALETASLIEGAVGTKMIGLGHFPMSENYSRFRPYLLDALSAIETG